MAGASLLPLNALILVLSPRAGHLAERIGACLPMAVGSLIGGIGMLLFMRVRPGAQYMTSVLPAVLVFGVGLGVFVAPLTAVALRSLGERRAGIASGVNNAVARLAGLLATAAIPAASGLGGVHDIRGPVLSSAFTRVPDLRGVVRSRQCRSRSDDRRKTQVQLVANNYLIGRAAGNG